MKRFDHSEQIFCWQQMSLNMCWQCVSVSATASGLNPAIITWLASTKAQKHVLIKGLNLNFQKSLISYLQEQFTRQIFCDKWNWHASLINKDIWHKTNWKKVSHLHEQISRFGFYSVTGSWNQFNYKPIGDLCTTLHHRICQWYVFKDSIVSAYESNFWHFLKYVLCDVINDN